MLDNRKLTETARGFQPGPARDDEARRCLEDDRFPAVFSMLLQVEEELAESVSTYDRSESERTMDAGGLAALRKFRTDLEALLIPAVKEPAAPEPVDGEGS